MAKKWPRGVCKESGLVSTTTLDSIISAGSGNVTTFERSKMVEEMHIRQGWSQLRTVGTTLQHSSREANNAANYDGSCWVTTAVISRVSGLRLYLQEGLVW